MRRSARAILSLLAGLLAVAVSAAGEPDWSALADEDTVLVLTTDEDGEARETTIWVIVVDGTAYIRTSRGSTWGANVERTPEIALRSGETNYPARGTLVEDAEARERIIAAFEEKYGSNPILNWIRGDDPRIIRLDPR